MIQVPAIRKSRAVIAQRKAWRLDVSDEEYLDLLLVTKAEPIVRYYLQYPLYTKERTVEATEIYVVLDHSSKPSLSAYNQIDTDAVATWVLEDDKAVLDHLARQLEAMYLTKTMNPEMNPCAYITPAGATKALPVLGSQLPKLLFYGQYHEAILWSHGQKYTVRFIDGQLLVQTAVKDTVYLLPEALSHLPIKEVSNDPQYLLHNLLRKQRS